MRLYHTFCEEEFDEAGRVRRVRFHYPENFNFGYDVVDVLAEKTPDDRALVWCSAEGEEHIFTYADIAEQSNRTANLFLQAGLGRGDRVIVALKRHYEYWFVAVALHKIGAVMIPVTHMLTTDDIVYRLNASDARAVISTPQDIFPSRLLEAVEKTGSQAILWSVQQTLPGFRNFTEEIRTMPAQLERIPTDAHDPMFCFFTSGTTGNPKGVVHDFTYPLAHIVTAKYWQQAEEGGLHFTVAETGWAKASWGKIYGQWLVGSAVMVYDFDSFDPKQLAGIINQYRVTSFCAPPTFYRYLVKKGMPDLPYLRHAATAGEALSPDIFEAFRERTGLTIMAGYGQTETALVAANMLGWEGVDSSMGRPTPLYNVVLQEPDGTPTPQGDIGEVVLLPDEAGNHHLPGVFVEYLGNPGLYDEVWRGGVYHTGDAAWMDENGVLWFHGRMDDIIKTGGFRVGPYEIENVLSKHPAVLECSVVGVQDANRGQLIKAIVVPAAGYEPSRDLERELREFCNSHLAEYKWVRRVEFVEAMPKTISGKIQKNILRK